MTLLFVIGLAACSKSDDPLPEKVFQDVNKTAEDYLAEEPDLEDYYNFFRFQNDSDYTLYWFINTKFSPGGGLYYCRPGQQATTLIAMEYAWWLDDYEILIDNLMAVGWIEFYFDLPAPDDLPDWRVPNEFQDTCAMYVFTALEPNSPKKTPKDPSQWKFEKFSDHSVRWTYRVTNADYDEAVRQTEERWAEKDDGPLQVKSEIPLQQYHRMNFLSDIPTQCIKSEIQWRLNYADHKQGMTVFCQFCQIPGSSSFQG